VIERVGGGEWKREGKRREGRGGRERERGKGEGERLRGKEERARSLLTMK